MRPLVLDDDRLLPTEPGVRAVARELYAQVRDLPIISMHGHVDAELLARDEPFPDPASLLITPDHYVTRMLASAGVPLTDLGAQRSDGVPVEHDPRKVWRTFCARWHLFRGTPSRTWLEQELAELFGVSVHPSPETADATYDQVAACLQDPGFRPSALLRRFGVEVLATTDPADSDLAAHRVVAARDGEGLVVPTMRPDAAVRLDGPGWRSAVEALARSCDLPTDTYDGYLAALRAQREHFVRHGALATDHGATTADTAPMSSRDAARTYADALAGRVDAAAADAFAAHMLTEAAAMSADDGLVMQLHPGVLRDHSGPVARQHGADRGYDIPVPTDFVRGLRPLLERFGHHPDFRLVVFTVDETTFSRELAPLAGAYPALRLGAPWWFLDSPLAMRRAREAVVETAGFYNTAGFVDDTRALCSIPARHDVARRVDSGVLADLVARGVLGLDEAAETLTDLVVSIPREAYARRPAILSA